MNSPSILRFTKYLILITVTINFLGRSVATKGPYFEDCRTRSGQLNSLLDSRKLLCARNRSRHQLLNRQHKIPKSTVHKDVESALEQFDYYRLHADVFECNIPWNGQRA
jgi:hypothetical protein